MIENIVGRAKKMAIKDFLEANQKGLRVSHLLQACVDEFKENEDLPNTTNPDDWARISGKKGRADRLHPYARHRKAGRGHRTLHRHGGEHRSVPVKGGAAAGALSGYPQPTVFRSPDWSKAMPQMISPPAQRRSRLFRTAESRSAGTGTAHASERQRYLSGAHDGRRRARRAA